MNSQGMPSFGKADEHPFWKIGGGNGLPSALVIDDSEIHGRGIFTRVKIDAETNIGPMAIGLGSSGLWRVGVLGALLNHSEENNCERRASKDSEGHTPEIWELWTTEVIQAGEELTIFYEAKRGE